MRLRERPRATALGRYPTSRAISFTRAAVSGAISELLFSARETVEWET